MNDESPNGSDRAVRFSILLAGMLAELLLGPLLLTSETGLQAARIVGVMILLVALSAVRMHRGAIIVFIPVLIAQLFAHHSGTPSLQATAAVFRLVFFSYVTSAIVWHVLHQPGVTMDTVAGAACAYILLGVIWAQLYMLIEYAQPGSFNIPASFLVARDHTAALQYFSFVTLTSVGGDIQPVNAGSGSVAAAETLVGQLYLAITIARLVGLEAARRTR